MADPVRYDEPYVLKERTIEHGDLCAVARSYVHAETVPHFSIPVILGPGATMPSRPGGPGNAGYDIAASVAGTVPARGRLRVPTGLYMALAVGTFGRICPRSGLSLRQGIETGAGVIDSTYRGEIGVILHNLSDEPFEFKAGDRIAQLIVAPYYACEFHPVDALASTDRGTAGFGSSGTGSEPRA